MQKPLYQQKKRILLNYLYATIAGLLIIACAVTIALLNKTEVEANADVGVVEVSATTYVVPVKNASVIKDYSATELQYNETLKQWEIHRAVDFLANESVDVLAMTSGTVTNVYNNYLEGYVVEISHANGLISIYKSLSKVNVSVGNKVSTGQVIGEAGDSMAQESNMGNHLHFEVWLNGSKVNPNDYIDLGIK